MGRVLEHEPPDKQRMLSLARKVERALILEEVIRYPKPRNVSSMMMNRGTVAPPKFMQPFPAQTKEKGTREEEKNRGDDAGRWKETKGISKEVYEERRAKGQCFSCRQRFTLGHQRVCPERGLRVAVWEMVDSQEEQEVEEETKEGEETGEEWEMVCRALGATGDIRSEEEYPLSILLSGVVQAVPITVLVDGGATHNYASRNLCKTLGLEVTPTKPYGIRLRDNRKVFSQGICKNIILEFGDWEMGIEAYILDTLGPDLTLGMKWLQWLSPMTVDWRKMHMFFEWKGKKVSLKGDAE